MSLHNVRNYKMAKIFDRDLEILIKKVKNDIEYYSNFIAYRPIKRIVAHLTDELAILESHKTDCNKILATKGQVKQETQDEQ